MASLTSITIRPLRALSEMRAVVELQKIYWGDDSESVVPAHMLFSLANYGGHVLAAYDGDRAIGVLIGFLGTHMEEPERPAMANLQLVSKRMVVLPEYRGHGIAYQMKKAQRDLALKQAVRLVIWTFDPLLSTNAHLNIRKLGAISHDYREDYYGTSSEGGLARLGSSDRLLVEWWVTSRRVEERMLGSRAGLALKQDLVGETPILNPSRALSSGFSAPADAPIAPGGALALLEIPTNYAEVQQADAGLAQAWRLHIRAAFESLFARGFVVTDFLHESYEGRPRAFYVLTYSGPQFEAYVMN